jgi:hypothetical protein
MAATGNFLVRSLRSIAYALSSHGDSALIEERRDLPRFASIRAGGAFDIRVRKGLSEVVVRCDESLIQDVETRVEGSTLVIQSRFGIGRMLGLGPVLGQR